MKKDIQKGKWLENTSCPKCGSSDGNALYDDGHSFCFACNTHVSSYDITNGITKDTKYKVTTLKDKYKNTTMEYIEHRKITKDTMKAYGVSAKVGTNGTIVSLSIPFGSSTQIREPRGNGQKENITTIGSSDDIKLFGQDTFSAGSAKAITITEGAYDALSAYQILGSKYPAVSVRSAATARRDCERARAYLNSFDHIYLCFDADEPGQRAAKEIATLFDVNKVFHVQLTKHKDANDYLQAGDTKEFYNVWWNAKKFMPKGIISDYKSIEDILKKESAKATASYPFATLDAMAYGIRLGELVLFTALEKVGKTEVLRAIEYHLLKTTEDNVGVIHLEEEEKRSVQGLVSYELGVPCHLPDAGISVADQIAAYQKITKTDGRLHFYTHFGSDDPNTILDIIRYLVGVCHCKYIFLDHITMLVTGFEDEDERKKLDYISTRLAMMTRELDFTLFLVSHVNDSGQTRGSRNIAKVADLIIHLNRDIEAATADERNCTRLICKGNRFAGTTGPAGVLTFNPASYTIKEAVPEFDFEVKP